LRGREGGRYKPKGSDRIAYFCENSSPSIPALLVAAFAATNIGHSIVPRAEPGA